MAHRCRGAGAVHPIKNSGTAFTARGSNISKGKVGANASLLFKLLVFVQCDVHAAVLEAPMIRRLSGFLPQMRRLSLSLSIGAMTALLLVIPVGAGDAVKPSANGLVDLGVQPVSPSYSCHLPLEDFEIAICENPYLAAMDKAIDRLYRALPANAPGRREHVVWNALRQKCGSDAGCIFDLQERSYDAMIGDADREPWLQAATQQLFSGTLKWTSHNWNLPVAKGECVRTSFARIAYDIPSTTQSLTVDALFNNGSQFVSWMNVPLLAKSRPGDPAEICFYSFENYCHRCKAPVNFYVITILRMHESVKRPVKDIKCDCTGGDGPDDQ
jgi:hypothetical protein